jgi:hypothetical protein
MNFEDIRKLYTTLEKVLCPDFDRSSVRILGKISREKVGGKMSSKKENKGEDNKPKQQRIKNLVQAEEFFGPQYNTTKELPDPDPSLRILATGVVEVIAGTRQVDQLARLLSDDVYQRLSRRAIEARNLRISTGQKTRYQNFSIRNILNSSPRDGVIESVVLLNAQRRTRAVTIRLEGINNRWRATSVSVL